MNPSPKISIILPVYNAQRYLALALRSLLLQTRQDFELIAIDDGSTDNSLAILQHYAAHDLRLRAISRPNTGIVGALNDGLAAGTAPYVARMDADDFSLPERLARQAAYLDQHPECVALGSAVDFMDAWDSRVMPCPRPTEHEEIEAGLLSGDGGMIIHPSVMLRRAALEAVGGYRREAQHVEDLDLYLRLARIGRLANLTNTLLYYRVHTASINFTRDAQRHRTKLAVLAAAYQTRGLVFQPENFPDRNPSWQNLARHSRAWAVAALQFGTRRVAIRYGLNACRLDPWNRASWRSLAYALTAPLSPPTLSARRAITSPPF